MQKMIYGEIERAAWDVQKLRSLGINEEGIAETHPSPDQIAGLLRGLLYLKEKYPSFWAIDE